MQIQVVDQKRVLSPKAVAAYFEEPPQKAGTFISIGAFGLLIWSAIYFSFYKGPANIWMFMTLGAVSIPLIIGICALVIYNLKSRPTDEEYEAWVSSFSISIQHYGLQKLNLDLNEIHGEILSIRGLVLPNNRYEAGYYHSSGCPVLAKRGKDGHLHTSINKYTIIYPAQHYLAIFNGDVNALSPLRFEGTRTYFYDDIVGVDGYSFGVQLDTAMYQLQHFEVRMSSGQSIGITTRINDDGVEQMVRSLRILLRDKKYGIRGGGRGLVGF